MQLYTPLYLILRDTCINKLLLFYISIVFVIYKYIYKYIYYISIINIVYINKNEKII
jgi:hypothetical protein